LLLFNSISEHEVITQNQECGSGSWKWLNFCGSGSTLKKEAGSESIFHKTWDRDVEAETGSGSG